MDFEQPIATGVITDGNLKYLVNVYKFTEPKQGEPASAVCIDEQGEVVTVPVTKIRITRPLPTQNETEREDNGRRATVSDFTNVGE